MAVELRQAMLEVDFLNEVAIRHDKQFLLPKSTQNPSGKIVEIPKYTFKDGMKDRFLTEVAGSYWHDPGKDELETVIFYTDNTCFAQRRKLKYSFETKSNYHESYRFIAPGQNEILELRNNIYLFLDTIKWIGEVETIQMTNKVDSELLFFDQTYGKKIRQKEMSLQACDWRVLPDIDDSYTGEKDEWKKYRAELRSLLIKKPQDFTRPMDFFKDITTMKWPVDPKTYRTEYPNGQDENGVAVEYLKADDEKQWVETPTEGATDVWNNRLLAMNELRNKYKDSSQIVAAELRTFMKKIKLEDFVAGGIDYTKLYTQEEFDALGE
tara:strand:- start:1431 stop:2402 length:972 start_codon:yes stop_codon:yes gene_type:complete